MKNLGQKLTKAGQALGTGLALTAAVAGCAYQPSGKYTIKLNPQIDKCTLYIDGDEDGVECKTNSGDKWVFFDFTNNKLVDYAELFSPQGKSEMILIRRRFYPSGLFDILNSEQIYLSKYLIKSPQIQEAFDKTIQEASDKTKKGQKEI